MSIDEVRAWFVARGYEIGAEARLLYERVAGQLAPDETLELEAAMTCNNMAGYLVLTDQRLIHIGTNIMGMKITTIARSDVTSVEKSGLLIPGMLVIHRGGYVRFGGGSKPKVQALMAALS